MFSDKIPHEGDAGYIARELLQDVSELDSKCIVIQKTVADGDFALKEALQLYEVTEEQYVDFLLKKSSQG